jgi:tetratricopeptide (TPR) repeat protein
MPDVAKLKKKAAELELKKQFDKALAVYVEILDSYEGSSEEVDVALYNRVGDIYLRQGNVADAVDYSEKAVDHYVENGFFNNAIALCNKILRSSPGRASIYYKLGKISAHKGFKSDAKANFLEYADRMQKAGKINEAFRALKEYADLCPDQDDIRQMLADQLIKQDRRDEAVEQLQLLYERYVHDGRNTEAQATIARMKSIDPSVQPRTPGTAPRRNTGDLIFLDLDDSAPTPSQRSSLAQRATQGLNIIATGESEDLTPRASAPAQPRAAAAPPPAEAPPEVDTFIASSPTDDLLGSSPLEQSMLDDMTRSAEFERLDNTGRPGLLDGLQTSPFGESDAFAESERLLGLEPTGLGATEEEAAGDRAQLLDIDQSVQVPTTESERPSLTDLPIIVDGGDVAPVRPEEEGTIGGDLEIIMPEDIKFSRGKSGAPPRPAEEMPLMDFELPPAREPTARPGRSDPKKLDVGEPTVEFEIEPEPSLEARPPAAPPKPAPTFAPKPASAPAPRAAPVPAPTKPAAAVPSPPARPSAPVARPGAPAAAPAKPALVPPRPAPQPARPTTAPSAPAARASAPPSVPATAAKPPTREEEEQEPTTIPTPTGARRSSTMMAVHSVELLQAMVDSDPEDFSIRRRLAESMLDTGDRDGGLRELEAAMLGFERTEDLDAASSIADEIVRLNPGSVRHHQKRVEYAFRRNEKARLIEAYLALADALFAASQIEKSRAIYQRVLDLAPDDIRAQAALESFPAPEPAPTPPAPATGRQKVGTRPQPAAPAPRPGAPDDDFVNLGEWLRGDEAAKSTRMVVEEQEPTGDEEADFQDMLRKFKQGIAENVEEEDHQSHYDLGVAYKEMGLLDEAIAEFQKALRAPTHRVPTYEALGQCFMEKEQYQMAATILSRALNEKGVTEDQLVGVLYLLGRCAEERGQRDLALDYYQRVFVVDIQFRDVGERLAAVEGAGS